MFRDADAVRARCIDHQHAAGAGRGYINIVDPGSSAAHDAKIAGGGEELLRHLGGAPHQEPIRIGQIPGEIHRAPPGSGIHIPAFRAEKFERRLREVVGDDDFQFDLGLGPRVLK